MESPEIRYSVSVPPTVEPLTLEQVKTALRIDTSSEDTRIRGWIQDAREWIESYLQRALVEQTLIARMRDFPRGESFELPMTNLISVDSITYVDDDGATQTLATSVYGTDTTRNPGLVYLKYNQSWPTVRDEHNAVTVTYKAGFVNSGASPEDLTDRIPERVKSALILIVADRYENRQEKEIADLKPTGAVESLLYPLRVMQL